MKPRRFSVGPASALSVLPALTLPAFVFLAACGDSPVDRHAAGVEFDDETGVTYIGSEQCGACHRAEYAQWRDSHHDLALQPANEATVLGDFADATFEFGGSRTAFTQRDGEFFVTTGGVEEVPREYRVVHTLGIEPLQQYLLEFEAGRLQAFAIAWDSRPAAEGGQRWFSLSDPASMQSEDPFHWTGIFQNWNSMCADCHSTAIQRRYDLATDSYATARADEDVGCESCHGPGEAHAGNPVENALLLASVRRSWVFQPGQSIASGIPDAGGSDSADGESAEIDRCANCHSRRAQLMDADPAASFLDLYVPELLRSGLYHDDGQILDEVYVYGSFVQSRMFDAGVTCSDCHEPHSLALRAPGDSLCAGCHASDVFESESHHRHAASGTVAVQPGCRDCHMRAETYMGVDPRRDHSFRVPRPDLSVALGVPNACNDCHRDRVPAWAAEAIARWFPDGRQTKPHFAQAFAGVRAWQLDPAEVLIPIVLDASEPAIVRATALELSGAAINVLTAESLESIATDDNDLIRLALARAAASLLPDRRVGVVQRYLTETPDAIRFAAIDALLPVRASLSPGRQADLDAAVRAAVDAAFYDGDRPESLLRAANLYNQRGNPAEARRLLEIAVERYPWSAPVYVNFADLERALGRDEAALARIDAGLLDLPEAPALHVARGLALVRLDRRDEGLGAFRRAAALAPDDPYNAYVLGLAEHAAGSVEDAFRTLQTAADRFPAYADLWFALATMARDRGDVLAATGYAARGRAMAAGDGRFPLLLEALAGQGTQQD